MNDPVWYLSVNEIYCVTAGDHLLHRYLDFPPAQRRPITSTRSGHVLVAGYFTRDGIHIYTPQGDHVGTLDHGLQSGKYIRGIQCSDEGLLQVLVGGWDTVRDLYAYRVS